RHEVAIMGENPKPSDRWSRLKETIIGVVLWRVIDTLVGYIQGVVTTPLTVLSPSLDLRSLLTLLVAFFLVFVAFTLSDRLRYGASTSTTLRPYSPRVQSRLGWRPRQNIRDKTWQDRMVNFAVIGGILVGFSYVTYQIPTPNVTPP